MTADDDGATPWPFIGALALGGALGTVAATRFASGHLNDLRLRIYGDRGGLEVTWEKNISGLRACLEPDLQSGTWHNVDAPVLATIYERFIAAIRGEEAPSGQVRASHKGVFGRLRDAFNAH